MNDSAHLPPPPAETPPEDSSKGRTGPTSSDGRARSSENAITHGCRSTKLILRHEDPAEFEALRAAWYRHYQPEPGIASALVEETVRAHWLLKRAQKHLEDIEWQLPADAYHWTEEHERLYRNFTRYKTSYERTFLRYFKELEAHCNRHTPAAEMKQRALAAAARFQAQSSVETQSSTEEKQSARDSEPGYAQGDAPEPSIGSQPSEKLPTPHCRT